MNNYRFKLDNKSKKFNCPGCNKKTLVRYIDTENGNYLPENYGRCDREIKCNYHLNPYKDGYSIMIYEQEKGILASFKKKQSATYQTQPKQKISEPAYIPYEILKATQKGYEKNNFIQNLLFNITFPFTKEVIENIISLYQLGTICKGYRAGSITFPFIDIDGKIRTIQVKNFDKSNYTTSTDFLHSILEKFYFKEKKTLPAWLSSYLTNDRKVSCLFGEHLITKYSVNPIALVEAPKTAIIATLYFGFPRDPKNLLWLGVYNLSSLNIEKCKILAGRKVYLFPDLNAFKKWNDKAKEFEIAMPGTFFNVSDLIEKYANMQEREKGLDIADYLIQLDWKEFNNLKNN